MAEFVGNRPLSEEELELEAVGKVLEGIADELYAIPVEPDPDFAGRLGRKLTESWSSVVCSDSPAPVLVTSTVEFRAPNPVTISRGSGAAHQPSGGNAASYRFVEELAHRSPRSLSKPLHLVAAVVVFVLAVAALAVPFAGSQKRDQLAPAAAAVVVHSGRGAAILTSSGWAELVAGDEIPAGSLIRSGADRLSIRLADDSVVRFDRVTYGKLELVSDDPSITVGEGRIYAEVNSSGGVEVKVDGITIASHRPGSGFSVQDDGTVVVTEGSATVHRQGDDPGRLLESGESHPVDAERDAAVAEWLDWNLAGGRDHATARVGGGRRSRTRRARY